MAEQDNKQIDRRKFIQLSTVGLVATSLTGLTACSSGDSGSTSTPEPKASAPAPKPAGSPPKPTAPTTAARVAEDDPVAQSLGYKHNAAEVDLVKYPKRGEASASNEYCKNCLLFQAGADDEWGPCSIFGGRLVHPDGWCATYAPNS